MYATVRRYEGIDKVRSDEITRKVTESLLPSISKLPGFSGYFLIDAGEGVLTSVGLFETPSRPTSRPGSQPAGSARTTWRRRFRAPPR